MLEREQDSFVFNLWLARYSVGEKQVCCAGESWKSCNSLWMIV